MPMPQIIHDHNKWQWQQLCEMAKNKNAVPATTKSPEKHKHSVLFYISPSLFDNKRLKQKRAKWAAAAYQTADGDYQHHHAHTTPVNKKTDFIGRRPTQLVPAVTIDLLSDDEEDCDPRNKAATMAGPPPLAPIQGIQLHPNMNGQPLQHFLVYPGSLPGLQLSNASNIRLIPLPHISIDALQQQTLELQKLKDDQQQQLQQQQLEQQQQLKHQQPLQQQQLKTQPQSKRKRKSHQPKRHSQPTIVNNESIVLTDDSDVEGAAPEQQISPAPITAIAVPTIVHSSSAINANVTQESLNNARDLSPTRIAQVDEEVTVSLVPRSSTGSCSSKTANSKLFPMQPDETTVHTVIANRIYELSLTKLREGLGIDCDQNGQPKANPTRRKGKTNGPMLTTSEEQQGPISLKLSSDLSISLISDDDEEETEDTDMHQSFNPGKLQLPPQLAVQQVRMPAIATADTGQLPRRRKLG